MKKFNYLLMLLSILFTVNTLALSPYENRLMLENKQRIGLMAFVSAKQVEKIKALTKQITANQTADLIDNNIHNLSLYLRDLNGQSVLFAYFESPDKRIQGWEARLSASSPLFKTLNTQLQAHPRSPQGQKWLRMEWINHIASDSVFPYQGRKIEKMGLMSGLKPEAELPYRQLHQANWPGVVDGMVKSNYRNWTTFLVEVEQALYLFTYTEYIGTNITEDNRLMSLDPTTQRWWRHTEPCLIDLHGEGNWSLMSPLM